MTEHIKNNIRRKSRRIATQIINFNIDEIEKLRAENLKNKKTDSDNMQTIKNIDINESNLDVHSFIKKQSENINDGLNKTEITKNSSEKNDCNKQTISENFTYEKIKQNNVMNNFSKNNDLYKQTIPENSNNTKYLFNQKFNTTKKDNIKSSNVILDLKEENRTFKFNSLMEWVHNFEKRELLPKNKFDYNYKKNKLKNSICKDINEEKNIIEMNLEENIVPKLSENIFIIYDRNLRNMKN